MRLKRGALRPPTGSSVRGILVRRVSPPSLFPLLKPVQTPEGALSGYERELVASSLSIYRQPSHIQHSRAAHQTLVSTKVPASQTRLLESCFQAGYVHVLGDGGI